MLIYLNFTMNKITPSLWDFEYCILLGYHNTPVKRDNLCRWHLYSLQSWTAATRDPVEAFRYE